MKTILLFTLLTTSIITNFASACSCADKTLEERYNEASVVIIGHITSTQEVKIIPPPKLGRKHQVKATYRTEKVFKGDPEPEGTIIDSIFSGGSCSVGLLSGNDYIIYIYETNEINICNGTHFYNETRDKDEVAKLIKLGNIK